MPVLEGRLALPRRGPRPRPRGRERGRQIDAPERPRRGAGAGGRLDAPRGRALRARLAVRGDGARGRLRAPGAEPLPQPQRGRERLPPRPAPARPPRGPRPARVAHARTCSERSGSTSRPRRSSSDLAPGERQLVEIAKALAFEARVVIFDEPTTSLSAPEAERLFASWAACGRRAAASSTSRTRSATCCASPTTSLVLRDGAVVGQGPRAEFDEARLISLMVGREIETVFPARRGAPTGEVALEARGASSGGRLAACGSPCTAARSSASRASWAPGEPRPCGPSSASTRWKRARCSWRAGGCSRRRAPRSPAAWRS